VPYLISFLETCDAPVGILHVHPRDLLNTAEAARTLARVRCLLGGMEVVQRARVGEQVFFGGDQRLYRYAVDPLVDTLPIVRLESWPALEAAV
jgi:hypothetical protein